MYSEKISLRNIAVLFGRECVSDSGMFGLFFLSVKIRDHKF